MVELQKRNDHLEVELVFMLEIQKECDRAKHMEVQLTNKCDFLEQELEKAKEKIRTWTISGRKVQDVFNNGNWKEYIGYDTK